MTTTTAVSDAGDGTGGGAPPCPARPRRAEALKAVEDAIDPAGGLQEAEWYALMFERYVRPLKHPASPEHLKGCAVGLTRAPWLHEDSCHCTVWPCRCGLRGDAPTKAKRIPKGPSRSKASGGLTFFSRLFLAAADGCLCRLQALPPTTCTADRLDFACERGRGVDFETRRLARKMADAEQRENGKFKDEVDIDEGRPGVGGASRRRVKAPRPRSVGVQAYTELDDYTPIVGEAARVLPARKSWRPRLRATPAKQAARHARHAARDRNARRAALRDRRTPPAARRAPPAAGASPRGSDDATDKSIIPPDTAEHSSCKKPPGEPTTTPPEPSRSSPVGPSVIKAPPEESTETSCRLPCKCPKVPPGELTQTPPVGPTVTKPHSKEPTGTPSAGTTVTPHGESIRNPGVPIRTPEEPTRTPAEQIGECPKAPSGEPAATPPIGLTGTEASSKSEAPRVKPTKSPDAASDKPIKTTKTSPPALASTSDTSSKIPPGSTGRVQKSPDILPPKKRKRKPKPMPKYYDDQYGSSVSSSKPRTAAPPARIVDRKIVPFDDKRTEKDELASVSSVCDLQGKRLTLHKQEPLRRKSGGGILKNVLHFFKWD